MAQQLNILMLNYEFPPIGGGAGKAHLCLLTEFANNNKLKIDVLTSAPKPGFVKEKFSDNITIYKVGVHKKNLHFWRKIEVIEWLFKAGFHYRRLLRNNDYDLAHAFFGFPTGWLCFRTAGKLPYIISLRGSDVPGRHARLILEYKLLAGLFKSVWKKASALIACSQGLKKRSLRLLPSANIDVIPNGVDLEKFFPDPDRKRTNVWKLITVGRLSVTKRIEILIDAIAILKEQGCKIDFSIVGGGSMEPGLAKIIEQRNLADIIHLTGRVESPKMPDLYRQNDVFISASMQEGMSNAMLEAMASGLPIITTRCEGLEELIADNGIIVEDADAKAIAEAIKGFFADEHTGNNMSVAAIRQVKTFTWDSVAKQYLQIYEQILKTKPTTRQDENTCAV